MSSTSASPSRPSEEDEAVLLPSPRSSPATRAILAGLTLLAFLLRAYRLSAQSLWSDEDITLDRAGEPLAAMLAGLPVEQAPGYYALMRGWTLLAGDGDLALRFPSLLAGVLAVPLAAYVGTRLTGRDTGMLMALIVAVNPFLVYYGQEARMYALLFTLSLAAVAFMLRARDAGGGQRWWLVCGAAVAAILYLHYYGALVVFGLAAWALFDLLERDREKLVGWLTAALAAGLLFAPWLPRALGVLDFEGWRSSLRLAEAPMAHATDWFAGRTVPDGHPATWLYLLAAVLGLSTLLAFETGWPKLRELAGGPVFDIRRISGLWLTPLMVYALLVLRTADLELGWSAATVDYDPRYAMAALPGLYLLVAQGAKLAMGLFLLFVAWLLRRLLPAGMRGALERASDKSEHGANTLGAILTAALILVAAWPGLQYSFRDPDWQKQDYRGFVATVEEAASHEDTVLLLDGPNYGLARRYEVEDSPVKIANLHSSGNLESRSPEQRIAFIAELAEVFPHVWLAEDGAVIGAAKTWLDAEAYPVGETAFQNITLRRYFHPVLAILDPAVLLDDPSLLRDLASAERWATLEPSSGIGLEPEGVRAESTDLKEGLTLARLAAGETLPVALRWRAGPALEQELKVAIRLLPAGAADANPLLASDRRPVNWTRPSSGWRAGETILDRHALVLPRSLELGVKRLEVVLYEEESLSEVGRWSAAVRVEPAR